MVETQNLLVSISVLFLVVVELTGRVHDADLRAISRRGGSIGEFPDFGRFTVIHTLCVLLLVLGYLMIVPVLLDSHSHPVVLIAIATGAIMAALPLMEVEDYDAFLGEGSPTRSLYVHVALTLGVTVLYPAIIAAWEDFLIPKYGLGLPFQENYPEFVLGILLIQGISRFFSELEAELVGDEAPDGGPGEETGASESAGDD